MISILRIFNSDGEKYNRPMVPIANVHAKVLKNGKNVYCLRKLNLKMDCVFLRGRV